MTSGIKWNTRADGKVEIDWTQLMDHRESLARNAVVNTLTISGSDKCLLERGTPMVQTLAAGGVPRVTSLQHAINFSALEAVDFTRVNDYAVDAAQTIRELRLDALDFVSAGARIGFLILSCQNGVNEPIMHRVWSSVGPPASPANRVRKGSCPYRSARPPGPTAGPVRTSEPADSRPPSVDSRNRGNRTA